MRTMKQYLKHYEDSIVPQAIRNMSMFRADAQNAQFVQHLVLATLSELFRHEYEEAKFVNSGLIPWDFSVPEGALSFGWNELSRTRGPDDGIVADDAEDIPAVEIAAGFNTNKVVTVAKAFKYSVQDVATAQMQGQWSLVTEKSAATREEHDTDVNNLVRTGNVDKGLPGLYRYPGISVVPATTGDWATATAQQIEDDFNAAVTAQMEATFGAGMADTALFSIAVWRRINTLRDTNDRRTVLEHLQAANPHITRWEWEDGLATAADAGSTTTASAFLYRNTPRSVRAVMPLRLVPMAPQEKGMVVKVLMRSRYGGIVAPKPKELVRLDGV